MPHSPPMTKNKVEENLVINLNNFNQEQVQKKKKQISLNLI
jgi:hypothetical protein